MRRAEVRINGTWVSFPPNSNWKAITSIDVAEQLHAGANVVEARVFNHTGPPALWLTLTTDQLKLRSDESWEVSFAGSPWRNAALAAAAKTPGPGNSIAGGERTFNAVKRLWPFWIVLIVVACVASLLWKVSFKKFSRAIAGTNTLARRCRPMAVVVLEQRTAVAIPRWVRFGGPSPIHQLCPATTGPAVAK